jgi:hypothetical protein
VPTELAGDEARRTGGAYSVCPCGWWVPAKPEVVAMVQEWWETTVRREKVCPRAIIGLVNLSCVVL